MTHTENDPKYSRRTFIMNDEEKKTFKELGINSEPETIWAFWERLGDKRGFDSRTVIGEGTTYTALPKGHGKHWCYPHRLKCVVKVYV